MTGARDPSLPAHDALADADDELGWDRAVIGTPDEAVAAHEGDPEPDVVAYDPDVDPFLKEG